MEFGLGGKSCFSFRCTPWQFPIAAIRHIFASFSNQRIEFSGIMVGDHLPVPIIQLPLVKAAHELRLLAERGFFNGDE
jgi:hypothetical protein